MHGFKSYLIIAGTKLSCKIRVLWPYRPVQQQLIDTGVHQQGGVSGLSANPGPSRYATDGAAFTHHQALGFGQLPYGGLGVGGRPSNKSAEAHNHYSSKVKGVKQKKLNVADENVTAVPVAISKRKEKMLPLSSPAQRIRPGASKERDSTRPVSLLEPPFTFLPVDMFTTCRWCLLFPTYSTQKRMKILVPLKSSNNGCSFFFFTDQNK